MNENSARRRIIDILRGEGKTIATIVKETGLSRPTVSHHLSFLEGAGFVEIHKYGSVRVFKISKVAKFEILKPIRKG